MTSFKSLSRVCSVLAACLFSISVHAGILEDDEARRAILDLRQRVESTQQRFGDDIRRANEENAQLRRSVLELSNQLEMRNRLAV